LSLIAKTQLDFFLPDYCIVFILFIVQLKRYRISIIVRLFNLVYRSERVQEEFGLAYYFVIRIHFGLEVKTAYIATLDFKPDIISR